MGEVLLVFGVELLYGILCMFGGICLKVMLDSDRNKKYGGKSNKKRNNFKKI